MVSAEHLQSKYSSNNTLEFTSVRIPSRLVYEPNHIHSRLPFAATSGLEEAKRRQLGIFINFVSWCVKYIIKGMTVEIVLCILVSSNM